jgi:hypothetical protein
VENDESKAEREARELAHDHTQLDEGRWFGSAEGENPVAKELIRRFKESKVERQCPHLTQNWDQARFWVEAVPELISCKRCTPVIAAKEQERANTLCLMCRRHTALRGVSIATAGYFLRSGICEECGAKHGLEP